jgi:hypothetical protein
MENKVFITGNEVDRAKNIASEQIDAWLNSGTKYIRDFDNSTIEGMFQSRLTGYLAEIGFGKMIDQPFHIPEGAEQKKPDFYFREWSIDVKGTYRKDGRLIAHLKKTRRDFDIFVLCRVGLPFVEFGGWVFSPEFIHKKRIRDLGHGQTYVFPNKFLRTWEDFSGLPNRNGHSKKFYKYRLDDE